MTNLDFQAAIFDLDGTLVDSMPHWRGLLEDFLEPYGVTPDREAKAAVCQMTLRQAAVYAKNRYCLEESVDELYQQLKKQEESIYTHRCTLKPGVADYLEALKQRRIPMGIATLAEKKCAKRALKRLGIQKYFSCLLTDEDVGKGKNSPELYLATAKKLKCPPDRCAVFEDSVAHGTVAKQAGFRVYAVKDATNADRYAAYAASVDGEAPWQ